MITSIFSKSKPINFIIVSVFVVVLFVISNFRELFTDLDNTLIALVKLIVTLFLVFLLDFIISKNNLTKGNSYAIMIFGLLLGMFPEVLRYSDLLFANLFVLFALRRLLSLHSNIAIKKKFFDAGFWIMLATLFYFWSILFFALVILVLIHYSKNDIKNIIIPFVGIATIFVLLLAYNSIVHNAYVRPSNFEFFSSFNYTAYNSIAFIVKFTALFTSFIWTFIYFFKVFTEKNKKLKPSFILTAWWCIIAVLIAIIAPLKNGSEFMFVFAPLAIIMANYIEAISDRWFKEVFISLLIITPILSLLL